MNVKLKYFCILINDIYQYSVNILGKVKFTVKVILWLSHCPQSRDKFIDQDGL